MKKIITDEEIQKILTFSYRNNTPRIRELLNALPEVPETKDESLREDIRRLIRNNGRSNMITVSELEEVLGDI